MKTLDELVDIAVEMCASPGVIRLAERRQPLSAEVARARLRAVVQRDRATTCSPRSFFWLPSVGRWVFSGWAPDGKRHRPIYRWSWP